MIFICSSAISMKKERCDEKTLSKGKYRWPDGATYEGDWEEGKMTGKGKYTWSNGDIYTGDWKSGRMSGRGVMKWFTGDVFDGFWLEGSRHGPGCYRFANGNYYCFGTWSKGLLLHGSGTHYPCSDVGSRKKEVSLQGRRSCYPVQLGIRYSVGRITPLPMWEVRSSDFGERVKIYFPRKGSRLTAPHHSISFYWEDYCPMVFRNLRVLFKLNAADYMMSICGDDDLRELSSPGKSGGTFYLSHDERFVIRTVKKHELKVLLKMLPRYYSHAEAHDNTLITKFFGAHSMKLRRGKKVRFVVMGNMFTTDFGYDLKGKITSKDNKIYESSTFEGLDLSYMFHMATSLHEALFRAARQHAETQIHNIQIVPPRATHEDEDTSKYYDQNRRRISNDGLIVSSKHIIGALITHMAKFDDKMTKLVEIFFGVI